QHSPGVFDVIHISGNLSNSIIENNYVGTRTPRHFLYLNKRDTFSGISNNHGRVLDEFMVFLDQERNEKQFMVGTLNLGNSFLFVDGSGKLRIKHGSYPTGSLDGELIGDYTTE